MLGGVVELFGFKDIILSASGHGMREGERLGMRHGCQLGRRT